MVLFLWLRISNSCLNTFHISIQRFIRENIWRNCAFLKDWIYEGIDAGVEKRETILFHYILKIE